MSELSAPKYPRRSQKQVDEAVRIEQALQREHAAELKGQKGRRRLGVIVVAATVFAAGAGVAAGFITADKPGPRPTPEGGCAVTFGASDTLLELMDRSGTNAVELEQLNPGRTVRDFKEGDTVILDSCGDLAEDHEVTPRS